jgi:hypothetical protein
LYFQGFTDGHLLALTTAQGGNKTNMKTKLMALILVAGGSLFAQTQFSVGVNFGSPGYYPPAPVAVHAYRPVTPGPGYVWVDGYHDAWGRWVAGYWALPPYPGAYWVAPRFTGGRFAGGYWGGERHDRNDNRFRESPNHGYERNGFRR